VLIVGYQAEGTLGRRLVERRPDVRILGRICQVRAEIVVMNGFSSHADQNDFDTFLGPLAPQTKQVCLVHGEMDRAEALATRLRELGFANVTIPDRGEVVTIV
jgi:metallo-beta-lactamase family protein